MVEPSPRSMNRGSPPTDRYARTGLFTPPGSRLNARSMSRAERSIVSKVRASRLSPLPCKTRKPPCERLTEVYYPRPLPAVTELTPMEGRYRPVENLLGVPQVPARSVSQEHHSSTPLP